MILKYCVTIAHDAVPDASIGIAFLFVASTVK